MPSDSVKHIKINHLSIFESHTMISKTNHKGTHFPFSIIPSTMEPHFQGGGMGQSRNFRSDRLGQFLYLFEPLLLSVKVRIIIVP